MSILHVNQIDGALHRLFDGKIDLGDAQLGTPASEKIFLTRALARHLPSCSLAVSLPMTRHSLSRTAPVTM
jgi:hypothetical protein